MRLLVSESRLLQEICHPDRDFLSSKRFISSGTFNSKMAFGKYGQTFNCLDCMEKSGCDLDAELFFGKCSPINYSASDLTPYPPDRWEQVATIQLALKLPRFQNTFPDSHTPVTVILISKTTEKHRTHTPQHTQSPRGVRTCCTLY